MILENFKLKGLRTSCVTGKEQEVELEVGVEPAIEGKEPILYLVGGPTGYESFYIEPGHLDGTRWDRFGGWYACSGTKNRWDTLFIPVAEMRRLMAVVKEVI